MAGPRARIAIVVLNHNGWQDARQCVLSLLGQSSPADRIIIVDNGSTDDSVARLGDMADGERVVLLRTEVNRGIAGGNNVGIRDALEHGADFILVISNDTVAAPDLLERLVGVAAVDGQVGAVGAKILYHAEPGRIWFCGGRMNPWLARAAHIAANVPDGSSLPALLDVDMLMACIMLVRREVFQTLGLFDERYFFQNEDLEFSYRMRRAGWKIKVDTRTHILHRIGRTIGAESADRWYYATRNRLLFIGENLAWPHRLVSFVFFAASRPLKFADWLRRGRPDLVAASVEGWRDYWGRRWGPRPRPERISESRRRAQEPRAGAHERRAGTERLP